jgi:hypothetical protein
MLAGFWFSQPQGRPLHTERGFFGVLRVTVDPSGTFYQLIHGNTVHGRQRIHFKGRPEPLAYYHQTGPIGQLFTKLERRLAHAKIGVIGLGVGSLAWYAQPDQEWTFYEIDPGVKRLAYDETYFRFLSDCRAKKLDVILGDARLRLHEAPLASYDLIILDAFSSDAVPTHMLTREALELYRKKLAKGGLLAFHVSNRFLNLKPVVGNLAGDIHWLCRSNEDTGVDAAEKALGKDPSEWIVMAAHKEDLGDLAKSTRWFPLTGQIGVPVWTDQFSNILGVVRWNEGNWE